MVPDAQYNPDTVCLQGQNDRNRPLLCYADVCHFTYRNLVGIMRHMTERDGTAGRRRLPKGIAFEIADLVLAQSWAAGQEAGIAIRLDHGAEDEEYEEVIELHTGAGPAPRLILWRNLIEIVVQPLPGRKQSFASMAEALDSLLPKQRAVLTDISAPAWPVD
nr:hypothetical protein [uncultured Rhodopila sp.]